MALLEVRRISKQFGGVQALDSVTLDVESGRVTGVIGPNGAGKTTLFNVITGLERPTRGQVLFRGQDITGLPLFEVTRRRIARTFQRSLPFGTMSVLENVLVGRYAFNPSGPRHLLRRWLNIRNDESADLAEANRLLSLVGLLDKADVPAGELPYGDQRRVEIARALACQPELLLLDEPAAGLSPDETGAIMRVVQQLSTAGYTVVLIEHNLPVIMSLCHTVAVLDHGVKIAEGSPAEIQRNEAVIEAYIGRKGHDALSR